MLQYGGLLPDITRLIGIKSEKPELTKVCELTEFRINQEICSNSDPTNEGHPTLLCGNLISHIVSDINKQSGRNVCKFEVFPVVRQSTDKRENKMCDYSIFRVFNRISYIVIEVKLVVGGTLTAGDKDHLAQIFLESVYTYEKEGKSTSNSTMLCVLTDGSTWHLIKTDMSCKPLEFKSVFSESTKQVQQWDSVSTICDVCIDHANLCIHV